MLGWSRGWRRWLTPTNSAWATGIHASKCCYFCNVMGFPPSFLMLQKQTCRFGIFFCAMARREATNRGSIKRNEGAWHDKNLPFHNAPNPVTERVVLFKHPFHLCRIPALGRDGGVGERLEKVQKCRLKRTKQNVRSSSSVRNTRSCPVGRWRHRPTQLLWELCCVHVLWK